MTRDKNWHNTVSHAAWPDNSHDMNQQMTLNKTTWNKQESSERQDTLNERSHWFDLCGQFLSVSTLKTNWLHVDWTFILHCVAEQKSWSSSQWFGFYSLLSFYDDPGSSHSVWECRTSSVHLSTAHTVTAGWGSRWPLCWATCHLSLSLSLCLSLSVSLSVCLCLNFNFNKLYWHDC